MKKIVTMALVSLASTLLFSQQVITDEEVVNASTTLLKTQNDSRSWQTLQKIVRTEEYAPDIRSRVMFLYAARNLLSMNTNMFASATQKLRTSYPEEGPALADRLTSADWLVTCKTCGGTGVKKSVIPQSGGGSVRCLNCVGTGKIFQLSPRVKQQFGTVLNEIKTISTENKQFSDSLKKAFAEKNQERRIKALKELLSKYAQRTDLDEARKALEKLETEIAEKEAETRRKEAVRELRYKEDREYRNISENLDKLPASGIDAMIREIDSYIEQFPESHNRLELEISKAKLERRKKTRAYTWTGFCICAGLVFATFCFSVLKGLLTRKKVETGPLPVPGLTEANEDSDPLAGTFEDSDPL